MQNSTGALRANWNGDKMYWQWRYVTADGARRAVGLGRDYDQSQGARGSVTQAEAEQLAELGEAALLSGADPAEQINARKAEIIRERAQQRAGASVGGQAAASLPPWCQPGVDGRPTIPPFCRYEDEQTLVVRYQTWTGDRLLATDFQLQPGGTWTRWEFSPPIPEGWSVVQSVSVDANGLRYPAAVMDTAGELWLRYAVYRSFADAVLPFERMRKRYAAVISLYLPNN